MDNPVTKALIKSIRKRVKPSPDKNTQAFLKDYYHRLSGQDFDPERTEFLFNAATLHRTMADKRQAGVPSIQFNQISSGDGSIRSLVSIVADDRPFIINSLTNILNRHNIRLDRTIHPLFNVKRDKKNRIQTINRFRSGALSNSAHKATRIESFIQFETQALTKDDELLIREQCLKSLARIEVVTSDWRYMRETALSLAEMIERNPQGPAFAEYGELLRWMTENNFAFIGYTEVETNPTTGKIKLLVDSLAGNLRSAHDNGEDVLSVLPPIVQNCISPVIFTKSRKRVHIHRSNYLDCILIEHSFNQKPRGQSTKKRVSCILGFQAGSTATTPIAGIPHLRSKASFILSQSTLRKGSYAYKELRTLIDTLPREMIFQLGSKDLYSLCMTLLNHQERRKTRVYIHRNICSHFFSCLVYVPRDLFNTDLRQKILELLRLKLQAFEITFNVYFSESVLTRIHFTAHVDPTQKIKFDATKLESTIQNMARDFNENLLVAAQKVGDIESSGELLEGWRNSFPRNYRDSFSAEQALEDINYLQDLKPGEVNQKLALPEDGKTQHQNAAMFKLFSAQSPAALSDVLPVLENFGVRVLTEYPYHIVTNQGQEYWINDFQIIRKDAGEISKILCTVFEQAFHNVWSGAADNDGFNQLIILSGIEWRQVNVIRACFRYLRQIRLRYSESYVVDELVKNPEIVRLLWQLFRNKFDPSVKNRQIGSIQGKLDSEVGKVKTLDEERIFRAMSDVINAILRTNYYQLHNGVPASYITFKIDSRKIPRIPEPAPKYEIFVYSPRMEGVHLRGGDVARGGLRWSERPEDYRTEVLGLVKAQRVKNAVIVPVGSKGGFVCKQLPEGPRDQVQKEVIACYQLFISSMLDITDNYVGNKVKPPVNVVRHDHDDPYLVVAADKGTATFSDIANSLSVDNNFWLGDAFASGGSAGYDHKKMGITARGAWESVKRHFRETSKDIQQQDFTVVGIGDMGGDVFGNGMLLSKHIQLIAAFNHLHIFIDPNPDAASSFKERQRLFKGPSSGWQEYNKKLVSSGGGVYLRSAKSIKLSPQAKKVLSAELSTYTPEELINVILKADVELLWNGGIGTYVKASSESHSDAQDRNNDGLRVNGSELKAKVVGEGGNLGLTQLGRIEYARLGGYCYTDAIDNSAGVDTSDHEVNIKILLADAINSGALASKSRDKLLASMEDEIATLVLQNNYMQTQILSLHANQSESRMPLQIDSIKELEVKGQLNREIEHLASQTILEERFQNGDWLTRPELAVLLSYSKMDFYQTILDSPLPDDPYMNKDIMTYFPALMVKKFSKEIGQHRLKREIIATHLTNHMIGTMGPCFHLQAAVLTGAPADQIARGYVVVRDLLNIDCILNSVQLLDNKIGIAIQQEILETLESTTQSLIFWLVRSCPLPLDISATSKLYSQGLFQLTSDYRKKLQAHPSSLLSSIENPLKISGVNKDDIELLGVIAKLGRGFDIVSISLQNKQTVPVCAELYDFIDNNLSLNWIQKAIHGLPISSDWNQRARFSLDEQLRSVHADLVQNILDNSKTKQVKKLVEGWSQDNQGQLSAISTMISAMKTESNPDFAMLSVLVSEISRLSSKP